jgi:hypothetical protein
MKKNMGYVEEHCRLCEELVMKNMDYVEEHCSLCESILNPKPFTHSQTALGRTY